MNLEFINNHYKIKIVYSWISLKIENKVIFSLKIISNFTGINVYNYMEI